MRQYRLLRIARKRRYPLAERADERYALRIIEAIAPLKPQRQHSMKTSQNGVIRRRLAQHSAYALIERISGFHAAKVFDLKRPIVPGDTGVIFLFATFRGFIQQRTPRIEDMLTGRLADISGHQLRHHIFNIIYTTLPEVFPLPSASLAPRRSSVTVSQLSASRASILISGS